MNGKPKILYVEDDIDLGYVTRDNLELKGYEITLLKDGKSALDVFINNNSIYACLMLCSLRWTGLHLQKR